MGFCILTEAGLRLAASSNKENMALYAIVSAAGRWEKRSLLVGFL